MDKLAVFRRMLDPSNWPVKPGDYLIVEGEVYCFVTDDPLEERTRPILFEWRPDDGSGEPGWGLEHLDLL